MREILRRLNRFFFPPPGSSRWRRVLPYAVLGALTLIVLIAGAYAWEYTNSPEFCGTACHTMPPEFTAYLTSPHARVDCVECHIGRGFIATRITRKAGDAKHILSLAFKDYEFPITADDLRPARETCERCHFPEKFSDDSLQEIKRFRPDEQNTPYSIYLDMKTGGGSKREGLGRGIHWHVENEVFYYAEDMREQVIPYVQVVEDDGSITEYFDIEADFNPDILQEGDLKRMDCITCHNRITHLISHPPDTVDMLLSRGVISPTIPEIRRKAVEVYHDDYDSQQLAMNGIAGLEGYYEVVHPDFYRENQALIQEAVLALQQAYRDSVFPEQKADWNSHPNNTEHQYSPGCFRCHDGKHLNQVDEAIRLECNLCHAVPVVAGPTDFVATIQISRGPEPESHLNPNWITLHRDVFDPTCANCHTTDNPGGTDNSSFCSNSACHGNVWEFAGFDAPALREILQPQLEEFSQEAEQGPEGTLEALPLTFNGSIGMIMENRCGSCHGQEGIQGLNLTTYQLLMEGGETGPAIEPGNPGASLLVDRQTEDLPHFGQFTPEELELVIQWIEAGAPEG